MAWWCHNAWCLRERTPGCGFPNSQPGALAGEQRRVVRCVPPAVQCCPYRLYLVPGPQFRVPGNGSQGSSCLQTSLRGALSLQLQTPGCLASIGPAFHTQTLGSPSPCSAPGSLPQHAAPPSCFSWATVLGHVLHACLSVRNPARRQIPWAPRSKYLECIPSPRCRHPRPSLHPDL